MTSYTQTLGTPHNTASPAKSGFITLMDDAFLPGAVVFLKSLMHYNPQIKTPFVVLDCGLSDKAKERIKSQYVYTEFRQIKKENYRHIDMRNTPVRLKNTFYTLDVFAQTDFDRLVFFDMDTLVLGDVTPLFAETAHFAAVKCYIRRQDMLSDTFNSGVFVVNKPCISEQTYKELLAVAPRHLTSPDQDTLNAHFKGTVKYLDKAFNVEKRMLHSRRFEKYTKPANIRILHFVGCKPWQVPANKQEESYGEFEKLWRQWRDR